MVVVVVVVVVVSSKLWRELIGLLMENIVVVI